MFDLRYHVASLVAVFIALIVGILVGVGISGSGFVGDSERSLFEARIDELEGRVESLTRRSADLTRAQRTAQEVIEETYPALMANQLAGKRVALVFVGSVDRRTLALVEQTAADADAPGLLRMRALTMPIEIRALRTALAGRPALQPLATRARIADLGRRLAVEFVEGGETPLWQALSGRLVEERSGTDAPPADGVVLVRTVAPQSGDTARFLAGFYEGLASAGAPAVGVETSARRGGESAVEAFARADLATVDDLDLQPGRLALALLLAGAPGGHYGVKQSARDGVLPPVTVPAGG